MNTEKLAKRPSHAIWQVIDEKKDNKSRWIRVGAGWTNKDGSLYLRFDSYPVIGRIQLRAIEDQPKAEDGGH